MTNRGDILRVRLLDAPCSGCGRPVTVWLGWGRVVTADCGGERHECANALDSRARARENGRSEEAPNTTTPSSNILHRAPPNRLYSNSTKRLHSKIQTE